MSDDDKEKEDNAGKDDDDEDYRLPEGSIEESTEDEVMVAQFQGSYGKKKIPKKANKSQKSQPNHERILSKPSKQKKSSVSSRSTSGNTRR